MEMISKNQIIIDGCVQKETKLFDEIASFNISVHTGFYACVNNTEKKRYTYLRVIYPNEIDEYMEDIIQPNSMVRIYGKIDSEIYITDRGKYVYNKVICADKIVRIRFDKDLQEYVEVI